MSGPSQRPDREARGTGRARRTFARWTMDVLGNEWAGRKCPPMDHRTYRWNHEGEDYEVVAQSEDGGATWIGSAHEWRWHTSTKRFRKIALWTLYHWVVTDWLGLRTRLYYWALFRECARHERWRAPVPSPSRCPECGGPRHEPKMRDLFEPCPNAFHRCPDCGGTVNEPNMVPHLDWDDGLPCPSSFHGPVSPPECETCGGM